MMQHVEEREGVLEMMRQQKQALGLEWERPEPVPLSSLKTWYRHPWA